MSISAMKQALEALDCIKSLLHVREMRKLGEAMRTLRQAIEFEEMVKKGTKAWADTPDDWVDELRGGVEKREWVWLTYDEINEIYDEYGECRKYGYEEAIQEKLKEKNT
jgi:hypothetical protein